MQVAITVVFKVEVPDGTNLSRLYMDINTETTSVVSEEGYTPEATIDGYETLSADKIEDNEE